MRRIAVLVVSIFVLGGTAVAVALTPAGAHRAPRTQITAHRAPKTQITVVRPVNASGHAQPGYAISSQPRRNWIDCRFPEPSPAAVSPNIEFCFPTAFYAVACWKAAAAHKALCLQDPQKPTLVRFTRHGRFAPTGPAAPDKRGPLAIVLGDGDYCQIRGGGAWSSPPGHPHLVGYYSCRHDGAVWAHDLAPHNGVNQSQSMWTVRTAQFDSRHIVTRRVVQAYFVGTATP
jgi:hypothetical protein